MVYRLDKNNIDDLVRISAADGFPYKMTEASSRVYCGGTIPAGPCAQTYGCFDGENLIGVMTATFNIVFPCDDSPSGKTVHISGAYTLPESRGKGVATKLLKAIEDDAKLFGADYICCDSTADGLYRSFGFEPAPEDESRMWKRVSL